MEHYSELQQIRDLFKAHMLEDAKNFSDISKRMDSADVDRKSNHDEVMGKLSPLTDTYKSAETLGKWFMAFLLLTSIIIGIIVGIKSLKP